MYLQEVVARAQMREDQRRASQERLARRVVAIRRWRRLARYADRRASRLAERM